MNGWLIALIVIVNILGYFAIGTAISLRRIPRAWEMAKEQHPYIYEQKESVYEQSFFMVLFWPFYLPVSAIMRVFNHSINYHSPKEVEARINLANAKVKTAERQQTELQKKIDQLEKELGMK